MTSNQPPCEECRLTHDISAGARQYAYTKIYRAQMDYGDRLPWRDERKLFHEAIHEYEDKNPGKIGL